MFAVKEILETLYETFNATDDDRKQLILQALQEAYYELCGQASWEALRDTITYVYDSDADGMWLPPDVLGIDFVTDGTSVWKEGGMTASLDVNSIEKRWFIAEYARSALVEGKGLAVSSGSTSFTGASAITSAHVGEFIRIGGENAFYELASATTLTTAYRGPVQTSAEYAVRPAGTKRIKLLAEHAATDETAGVTIYCWRLPQQIYKSSDLCLLPRADILELATAEKLYGMTRETELKNGVQKDLYGSKGRYAGKIDKAIASNPDFMPPVLPRNKHGRVAGYGAR